jgi:glycine C-acetyltransferase
MDERDLLHTPLMRHFVSHYANPAGPDLLARTEPFFAWQDARRQAGLWPYSRSLEAAPQAECGVRSELGELRLGDNFASQDYLSLSTHPAVVEAAHRGIRDHGLHSAGSAMLGGNTAPGLRLEDALAEALAMPHVALFPTGWAAGFGAITALVRPDDHVVMDALSHACLQSGADAATRNVVRHRHLSHEAVAETLAAIRARDSVNGILVVTEGLFSMDSDTPRIDALQALCGEFGATLLVDAAHDFGALGPGGTGSVGMQRMLGRVDLVIGAFSKTFASNGGFLATRSPAVRQFVRVMGGPHIFSNAISPVQACVVREALSIVRSAEGEALRARVRGNAVALREGFAERGIGCLGDPSPVVPVPVGDAAVARLAAKRVFERGVFVNLVEYPAVPVRGSRFRMQVMAGHAPEQVRRAATIVADAVDEAREVVASARRRAAAPAVRPPLVGAD